MCRIIKILFGLRYAGYRKNSTYIKTYLIFLSRRQNYFSNIFYKSIID